ncbi:MAG: hypothetical protein WKG07_14305 [Hymenobacter sp.]
MRQPWAAMRQLCPTQWFLVPGIGAQGGDLAAVLAAGLLADGMGLLINASRSIWQAEDAGECSAGVDERYKRAPTSGESVERLRFYDVPTPYPRLPPAEVASILEAQLRAEDALLSGHFAALVGAAL